MKLLQERGLGIPPSLNNHLDDIKASGLVDREDMEDDIDDDHDTSDIILDDPNDKYLSVNAKLTTNAGISVSYVAPALPSSSQDSDTGWDTI